ncbi:phosphatase PAP2 family protein [Pyxidicoccus parkwayensis]|uniref:Phosphatase PAP2 family protein n=1 Tax=Pyxidicoccus parkwayensis TaxID=2813578 RepID=A0ABX7P6C7_9BACT|nr:phosphatase PAP2 family protein [Pyxidicoccus parkwaysis]QSQ26016.1 phosphatase PAP2 family protein [Pyxidicoccus parkwaysis]
MSERPRLFGVPRRDELLLTGSLALGFAFFFLAVYGGASWVTGFYSGGLRVDLPFERHIPFIPAWAAVYVSMDVLLLLSLFVFRTWKDMVPFALALCAETVVGAVVFVLLPVEVAWPARVVHDGWAGIFFVADTMNLERNYLPSLHVAFACTAALAYAERSGWLARVLFGLWAAAIAASTLFIHEHHLVDVVAGALLAWGMWRFIAPRARGEDFLAALRVEAFCARELYRFSRRHLRYALIALALYRYSLGRWWRAARVARVGFCFLQLVDDVLDGDRPVDGEPLDWVDALLTELEPGRGQGIGTEAMPGQMRATASEMAREQATDIAATLGRVLLDSLESPEARANVFALMRTMRRDRERVREQRWLSAEQLIAQHRDTFRLSVDLMLHVAGADVRASDVPALIDAFGWCSSLRDLREDLEAGLYNVPAEVAEEVRAEGANPADCDALLASTTGRAWVVAEYARARVLLDRSAEDLATLEGRTGVPLLRLFHRSIESFRARRLPRRLPFLREPASVKPWPSGAASSGPR